MKPIKKYFKELVEGDTIFFYEIKNMNKAVHPMKIVKVEDIDVFTIKVKISSGRELYIDKEQDESVIKLNVGNATCGYAVNLIGVKEEVKKYYDEQIKFTEFKLNTLIRLRNKLS